jgi:hypothetical protein
MNSFFEHHKDSIRWHYCCFDRILLNGLIQPFQQPERVVGFFNTYRQLYPVTRYTLRDIADQFQRWVKERAAKRNIPIMTHDTPLPFDLPTQETHRRFCRRQPVIQWRRAASAGGGAYVFACGSPKQCRIAAIRTASGMRCSGW